MNMGSPQLPDSMTCPVMACSKENKFEEKKCTYDSYLQINDLLKTVSPKTNVHDEHLFITIHQVDELWFRLVLHELSYVQEQLSKRPWTSIPVHAIRTRLRLVVSILKSVVENFHILETMPPLNFVDFRDELTGGSGFQSLQFRKIEKLLGLKDEQRMMYNGKSYTEKIQPKHKDILVNYPEPGENTLIEVVDTWLASTPGVDDQKFWQDYNQIVVGLEAAITDRYLSPAALKGALLINLHQDHAIFQQPSDILSLLQDIDAIFMKWRSTHINMVHRMIGEKQGTGGEAGQSGYEYLRTTYSDKYKIFCDLFDMATFLIPRKQVPENETLNKYLRGHL